MKITIEKTQNGYTLETEEGKRVYEERQTDIYDTYNLRNSLTTLQMLFFDIKEVLGVFNSKHNINNLRIEIEKNED